MRLLYVAMTRAEKWLILGAAGDLGKSDEESWYGLVSAAARERPHVEHDFGFGRGIRIEPVPWGDADKTPERSVVSETVLLEPIFRETVSPVKEAKTSISPSTDLGGAKALPSEMALDEDAAKLRGTQIHLLIEHFAETPPERWQTIADALLPDLPQLPDYVNEAASVINAPDISFIFENGTMSEVPITAQIRDLSEKPLYGIIDRLIVNDTDVWAIDFKTNVAIPETPHKCPEGLLRQMGAYSAALQKIYPSKRVRAGIVWTGNATLMELDAEQVNAAFLRADVSM